MKKYLFFLLICIGLLLGSGIASAREMEEVTINSGPSSGYTVKYKEDRKGGHTGFKLKVTYLGGQYSGRYSFDSDNRSDTNDRPSLSRAKRYSYSVYERENYKRERDANRLVRDAFRTYRQVSRDYGRTYSSDRWRRSGYGYRW